MGWFQKLSARMKLMLAFIGVSVILGGVAGYTLYELGKVNQSLETLQHRDLAGIVYADDANFMRACIGRQIRNLMLQTDSEAINRDRTKIEKYAEKFVEDCKGLEPTLATAEGKALLTEVQNCLPPYMVQVTKAADFVVQKKDSEAKAMLTKATEAGNKLEANLTKLVDLKQEMAKKSAELSSEMYHSTWYTVVVAIAIGTGSIDRSRLADRPMVRQGADRSLHDRRLLGGLVPGTSGRGRRTLQRSAGTGFQPGRNRFQPGGDYRHRSSRMPTMPSRPTNWRAIPARWPKRAARLSDEPSPGWAKINAASKKIADIITAIDEIAFQTNLLALNAAVRGCPCRRTGSRIRRGRCRSPQPGPAQCGRCQGDQGTHSGLGLEGRNRQQAGQTSPARPSTRSSRRSNA